MALAKIQPARVELSKQREEFGGRVALAPDCARGGIEKLGS